MQRQTEKSLTMRKTIVLLIALLTFVATQAQYLVQPSEPNEQCMAAWNDYQKADVLWKTGWGLFGAGAGMTVGGLLGWTLSNYQWMNAYDTSTWTHPGFAIMCVGGGMFFASIPCLAVGQTRRKAAMKIYDEYNCYPETCEQIRLNYHKADVLWKTGWGLFGAGAAGSIVFGTLGYLSMWSGHEPAPDKSATPNLSPLFWSFFAVSAGAFVASIPCLAVGQVNRKHNTKLYNRYCADQPPLTFSLQTSANGLGIAMNF